MKKPLYRKSNPRRYKKLDREKILAAALDLAWNQGWANVRMNHIASYFDVSLVDIRDCYRDMDAIADDWFDHALTEMLMLPDKKCHGLPAKERLYNVITCWLDALARHHLVSVQMISNKFYLFHPQHWMPMIPSLSNLINWILHSAKIDSQGRQRKFEEIGLTLLIIATLRVWVYDDSENQSKTHAFLRQRLEQADRFMGSLF